MKRALLLGLLLGGCFAPRYEDGHLVCASPGDVCPRGYHCARDRTCWHDGADPTGGGTTIFVSSGGGSATAPSGRRLNLSIGGTSTVGTVTAPGGARFTPGLLADDTL